MRTRMGCCGSTSRRGRTWLRTAPTILRPWLRPLMQGRARRSAGERQPKLLMRCRDQRRQVLRRPVEAKVKAANSASDDQAGREETAPIVEEELSIGKREVASGGA